MIATSAIRSGAPIIKITKASAATNAMIMRTRKAIASPPRT